MWNYPADLLGLPPRTTVEIKVGNGHLIGHSPVSGTFKLFVQPDGAWYEEDTHVRYLPIRTEAGAFAGIADVGSVVAGALNAATEKNTERAKTLLELVKGNVGLEVTIGRALVDLVAGQVKAAEEAVRALLRQAGAPQVEAAINNYGYQFLQEQKLRWALSVFELNARFFPQALDCWDSLGEAQMTLGKTEDAIQSYEKSLELNPENDNARTMMERMSQQEPKED